MNGKNYNHDKTITGEFFAKHESSKKVLRERGEGEKKHPIKVIFVQSCSTKAELDIGSQKDWMRSYHLTARAQLAKTLLS